MVTKPSMDRRMLECVVLERLFVSVRGKHVQQPGLTLMLLNAVSLPPGPCRGRLLQTMVSQEMATMAQISIQSQQQRGARNEKLQMQAWRRQVQKESQQMIRRCTLFRLLWDQLASSWCDSPNNCIWTLVGWQTKEEPKWFEVKVNTSVYVSGLPNDVTEAELMHVFSKCGIIKEGDDGRPKVKVYR
jgi:RNA recognition motif. (a.k.a. RRM, RBD, or RNP domain)